MVCHVPSWQIVNHLGRQVMLHRIFNEIRHILTVLSHFSCDQLCVTLQTIVHQAPPSTGFSRQEYWSRFPCPLPGDLLNPGIQPASPALAGGFACNVGRSGFNPRIGKIPWKREMLPIPVFWPGEFHGLFSPCGRKESNTTERLSLSHFHFLYQQHHLGSPIFSLEIGNIQSKSSELSILMMMKCSTSQLSLTL